MRSPLVVERFKPVMLELGPWRLSDYGRRRALCELGRRGHRPFIGGGSGQLSGFSEQAALNHLTGNDNASWANLNTQYLALCTTLPTSSSTGSTIVEATYTGYARLNIANWSGIATGTAPATSALQQLLGATTGSNNAAVGTQFWSGPAAIDGLNGTGSPTIAALNADQSNYLQGVYSFAVPSGATITGIQVQISRAATGVAVQDAVVSLLKAGVVTGTNKAFTGTNWPTSQGTQTYGSSSDLWGTTWAPSDINAANFGVVLSANGGAGSAPASVYWMQITVYYTMAFAACTGGTSTIIGVARCTALTVGNMLAWASVPSTVISTTQTPAVLSSLVSTLT